MSYVLVKFYKSEVLNMEFKRKIIQAGGSLGIHLPADLVHYLKLEPGTPITISVKGDTKIVIVLAEKKGLGYDGVQQE